MTALDYKRLRKSVLSFTSLIGEIDSEMATLAICDWNFWVSSSEELDLSRVFRCWG